MTKGEQSGAEYIEIGHRTSGLAPNVSGGVFGERRQRFSGRLMSPEVSNRIDGGCCNFPIAESLCRHVNLCQGRGLEFFC